MAMIEIDKLSKRYNDFLAVKDLSLTIEERDIFGFIGPNGAGKTTTIRVLATLLMPSSGKVSVDGINVVRHPYEVKKIVGYMPDSFGVYDGMRLREYLDFFGAAYKIPARKRQAIIDDVLELTDLTAKADDFVSAFSRGMKQRCCLAKTLIHDPKVLLLDEPASGLDPRARIEFRELLKTLRDMGDGADTAAQVLAENPGIHNVDRSGNEFQFETNLGREDLAVLHEVLFQKGVKVLFFEEDKGTLEDVFLHVTKGGI